MIGSTFNRRANITTAGVFGTTLLRALPVSKGGRSSIAAELLFAAYTAYSCGKELKEGGQSFSTAILAGAGAGAYGGLTTAMSCRNYVYQQDSTSSFPVPNDASIATSEIDTPLFVTVGSGIGCMISAGAYLVASAPVAKPKAA
jgi:hypothetical protein